jgi:hypothetical protein
VSRRRLTFTVVCLLVASLTTSASAICMAEPIVSAKAQMACCQAGHQHCPMHGRASDCCKTERQRQEQAVAATHEPGRSTLTPPAEVSSILPVIFVPVLELASRFTADRDVLKDPSPPQYLLGSAFLI